MMTTAQFQKTILDWYRDPRTRAPNESKPHTEQVRTVRGELPWRKTTDPYKILVSEVMLQQTQISRVLPKYKEFLRAFPTLETLAKAPDKKLMAVWAGLGYWRRVKYLKEAAKAILAARVANYQTSPRRRFGMVPPQADKSPRAQTPKPRRGFEGRSFEVWLPEHLEELPGIGHYTARAITCFSAKGGPALGGASCKAFLDTNIRRVYLHFFFPGRKNVSDKQILKIAQKAIDRLPKDITPREWHYALFDYGALVLKDKSINKRSRLYHKQSKFEGSFRSFRTKAVRFLLASPKNKVSHRQLQNFLKRELVDLKDQQVYTARQIIDALLKDKLIKQTRVHYFL